MSKRFPILILLIAAAMVFTACSPQPAVEVQGQWDGTANVAGASVPVGFTVDREPDNELASALLQEVKQSYDADEPLVTTLGLECEINTFFRLTSRTLIRRLRDSFPTMPKDPSPKEVFLRLRELRNHW